MKISLVVTVVRDYRSKDDDDVVKKERKSEVVNQSPGSVDIFVAIMCNSLSIVSVSSAHLHDHQWTDNSQ